MRILVIDNAGYIGSHICVELLNLGHEVVVVDNLCSPSEELLSRVEKITGRRSVLYQVDLLDKEGLEAMFAKETMDAVTRFAGLKTVGESVAKPLEYYHNNTTGTLALYDVTRNHGVKRTIFSSSVTVYGDPIFVPITGDYSRGKVTNPYGQTKGILEQILTGLHTADPEWSMILLRYLNPVGAHKNGLIGEDPTGIPDDLTSHVTQVAVGKLKEAGVFGNDYDMPGETGVRDYIHAVNLAIGHAKALDELMEDDAVRIYNLETGHGYSVLGMVRALSKACGKEIPCVIKPRRPGDVATCYADPALAKKELGQEAERGLKEICGDGQRRQPNNLNGYQQ